MKSLTLSITISQYQVFMMKYGILASKTWESWNLKIAVDLSRKCDTLMAKQAVSNYRKQSVVHLQNSRTIDRNRCG